MNHITKKTQLNKLGHVWTNNECVSEIILRLIQLFAPENA